MFNFINLTDMACGCKGGGKKGGKGSGGKKSK